MKIYTEVNWQWDDILKKYIEVSSNFFEYGGELHLADEENEGNEEDNSEIIIPEEYESPILYANKLSTRVLTEEEARITLDLGEPTAGDMELLSQNSLQTAQSVQDILAKDTEIFFIFQPDNQIGLTELYPTNNTIEGAGPEIISEFVGAVELEDYGNQALPFPEIFEEFNIGGEGPGSENLNAADAIAWAQEHNRDDISGFILAYIIGGDEGVSYLYENYGDDSSKNYFYDEDTHLEWIINQEIPKASDYMPERIPRDFEIFFNQGQPFKKLEMIIFDPTILDTTDNENSGRGWMFKLVGSAVEYDDVNFGDLNDDGITDDEEIIVDDSIDTLNDNYQTDEEISNEFGVPGVYIEQTLFNSYDSLSGFDIDKNIFENTEQGLLNADRDGRIALGMFSFDDENKFTSDNLPDLFRENKFKQIGINNLVRNGSGREMKSIWANKAETNNPRERFFIPEGGWGYSTLDGIAPDSRRREEGLYFYTAGQGGGQYSNYIEDMTNGPELINSFPQAPNFEEGLDNQDVIGNAGYHAYFFDYRISDEADGLTRQSLIRLQDNLVSASAGYLGSTESEFDTCNKFLKQNQVDSLGKQITDDGFPAVSKHASYLTPRKCTATGQNPTDSDNAETNIWFPNFAKWIIDKDFSEEGVSCFSYGRCLEFLSTNFRDGRLDFNDNGSDDSTNKTFDWMDEGSMNVANEGTLGNQYRSLNQVIKLYNPWRDTEINPFTTMEVKFKMKTWSKLYNSENPPIVEIAIIDGDSTTNYPLRTLDRQVGGSPPEPLPYAGRHGYWPHGDFNSTRYSDDINDIGTLNRKYSNFGSMNRFQNTDTDTWETFSYKFTMGEIFRYGSGIVRPFYLIVQATDNFYGRVWLDDFEVYESQDFIPDVDVRKKISVGKFGKGDLTKYYDPRIREQLEAYNDTVAPLEVQFYFYPQYPSDELFEVKRTPIYQDFKKGLFYIYDVDWGDGTPKEFVSEPEPIDEEKVLLHTYEKSGVFEVTGRMLRTKEGFNNSEVGVIKNKKFKLRIMVNEGLDEDFQYFGSDGFSFIPYKNTTPVIGGVSKQSAYYKAIKRQLGFIGEQKTTIFFKNAGDRLKTEVAFNKMDSSFNDELDLLNEYTKPRPLEETLEIIEGTCFFHDCNVNTFIASTKFNPELPTEGEDGIVAVLTCHPADSECIEFYGETAITKFDGETWISDNLTNFRDGFTYRFGVFDSSYSAEYCHEALGCEGFDTATSIPFSGGVEIFDSNGDGIDDEISQDSIYVDFTIPSETELSYQGFKIYSEELGDSLGDSDLTSIKYFNRVKPMWELLGLEAPNPDNFRSAIGSELIQNTDFGPLEAGTYGADEYVGQISWTHNTPPELKTDVIDGWDLFNEGPYAGNNMKLTNYYTSDFSVDDDRYPGFNVLYVKTTNSGRNRLIQVRSKDNIVEDGKKYRVRIELYPNEDFPPSLDFHPPVLTIDGGTNKVILHEGVSEFEWDVVFPTDNNVGKVIISNQLGQSGGHSFNLVSVSIKEIYEDTSIEDGVSLYSTEEEAEEAFNLDHPNNPMSNRYWKNIIPEDYSIYNREGIIDGELADPNSEQEWFDNYYYPVLPKYGLDGEFFQEVDGQIVPNPYPNGNKPYASNPFDILFVESSITSEMEFDKNLLINISSETLEANVFSDNSGNQNYGFGFTDYKPEFDNKTLGPKKIKKTQTIKSATNNGAF